MKTQLHSLFAFREGGITSLLFIAYGDHMPEVKAAFWIPSFAWWDLELPFCPAQTSHQHTDCPLTLTFSSCLTQHQGFKMYCEKDKKCERSFCRLVVGMLRRNGPWNAALASKTSSLCWGVLCKLSNHPPAAEIHVQGWNRTQSCNSQVEARLSAAVQVIKMMEKHQDWDVLSAFWGRAVATSLSRKMCHSSLSLWF